MRLTAHVKSSRVKFEAVQRHRRKNKEVRTEHSRFEGGCEVEQSKVQSSAATRHRRKDKEVGTERSRFESTVRSSTATPKER